MDLRLFFLHFDRYCIFYAVKWRIIYGKITKQDGNNAHKQAYLINRNTHDFINGAASIL